MKSDAFASPSVVPSVARLLHAVRKSVPGRTRSRSGNGTRAELERLALSSPHLLADLGFVEDRRAGSAQRAVWRKGEIVVSVSRDPGAVTARAEIGGAP